MDLFSGIGGITLALSEWVRPIAYCDIEPYSQQVLLSRMLEGKLPRAPIWNDVTTLRGTDLPKVDIIYGGFPCQDISVAGIGKGLEGKRSGLFFEIMRLAKEIKPKFLFLENVPAITSRGLETVIREINEIGYDARWCCLSAAEVGANHKRERWWLLAYSRCEQQRSDQNIQPKSKESIGTNITELCSHVSNTNSIGCNDGSDNREERYIQSSTIRQPSEIQQEWNERVVRTSEAYSVLSDTDSVRKLQQEGCKQIVGGWTGDFCEQDYFTRDWWSVEPNVGRVVNGLPNRVDRIKSLGNAVVPFCAKEAFKELMGIK